MPCIDFASLDRKRFSFHVFGLCKLPTVVNGDLLLCVLFDSTRLHNGQTFWDTVLVISDSLHWRTSSNRIETKFSL